MKDSKLSVVGVPDIHYFRSYKSLVLTNVMCVLKNLCLLEVIIN